MYSSIEINFENQCKSVWAVFFVFWMIAILISDTCGRTRILSGTLALKDTQMRWNWGPRSQVTKIIFIASSYSTWWNGSSLIYTVSGQDTCLQWKSLYFTPHVKPQIYPKPVLLNLTQLHLFCDCFEFYWCLRLPSQVMCICQKSCSSNRPVSWRN